MSSNTDNVPNYSTVGSAPRRANRSVREPGIGPDVYAVLAAIATLTIIGSAIGDATLAALLAPIGFAMVVYCMTRVPLRVSLMALIFLSFTLENPGDAENQWDGPFAGIGAMMLSHLNTVDRTLGFTSWMSFSGMDLCIATLMIIAVMRRKNGSSLERVDHVPTPRALVKMAFVTYAGIAVTELSGMMRGGQFSMSLWQIDRVVYVPTVFLLAHMCFRGPKDLAPLAKILVSAAVYKAFVAIYVSNTVDGDPDPLTNLPTKIACATNHADSILFACAFVLILAMLFERVPGKGKWWGLAMLPLISLGMIANNRRMAWVEVALVFLTVFIVARENPVKRKIRRALIVLSPAIVGYIIAGWESKAGIFKPAQMVRSIVDPQSDGSTMWREYENFNLITTFQMHPIIGSGYGNGYIEFFPMPEIPYDLEHYAPHNSILGLWCYAGYFGFFALTILWGGGIYFSMRAYHTCKEPAYRAAAQVSFGAILIYMVQCWGDMGLGTWTGVFTVGPSLAIASKLLVASGGWSDAKTKRVRAGAGSTTRPAGQPA